jgi:hypothetical protein
MDYKVEQFDTKSYRIAGMLNDKEITFNVVVASDESEIPELVECYMNGLLHPTPPMQNQQQQPDAHTILQELKAELDATKAEVALLKGAA